MIIFDATYKNIKLPSVNTKRVGAPIFNSHKAHLAGLMMDSALQWPNLPYKGPIEAIIAIITKKDIDNGLKAIFDALQDAEIIEDDSQIISLKKCIISRGGYPHGRDHVRIKLKKLNDRTIEKLKADHGGELVDA